MFGSDHRLLMIRSIGATNSVSSVSILGPQKMMIYSFILSLKRAHQISTWASKRMMDGMQAAIEANNALSSYRFVQSSAPILHWLV